MRINEKCNNSHTPNTGLINCILMNSPIQILAIRMGLSIILFKGSEFLNYDVFKSL